MSKDDYFKLPRLFVDAPLGADMAVPLNPDQAHYLHTVLRRTNDDLVRLFNGRDGEWACRLHDLGKKSGVALAIEHIKPQPEPSPGIHLFFAPIKKARLDWLVEKAVELGATHLHPVITQNTENRTLNEARLRQQIFEAAEQCERLDIPVLCNTAKLYNIHAEGTMLACIERGEPKPITQALPANGAISILIGPEGGFTDAEAQWIGEQKNWIQTNLGSRILRCETAVCVALSACQLRLMCA